MGYTTNEMMICPDCHGSYWVYSKTYVDGSKLNEEGNWTVSMTRETDIGRFFEHNRKEHPVRWKTLVAFVKESRENRREIVRTEDRISSLIREMQNNIDLELEELIMNEEETERG